MKITLGDFLNNFARKAGVPMDHPALKDFLSLTEVAGKEINRDLYDALDRALMTQAAAEAHPEVRKKIKGEALNGADALLERLFPELELEDTFLSEIKGNKNTFEKIEKTVKKLNELRKASASSSGKKKEDIEQDIERLNGELRILKATHDQALKAKDDQHSEEMRNLRLQMLLGSKKLNLPEEMDPELRTGTALSAVQRQAAAKGLKIIEENGVLTLRRADGAKYFDEGNREVSLTDFIDGALAQNKLLVVTDPNQLVPNPPVPPVPGDQKGNMNPSLANEIGQILQDAGAFTKQ